MLGTGMEASEAAGAALLYGSVVPLLASESIATGREAAKAAEGAVGGAVNSVDSAGVGSGVAALAPSACVPESACVELESGMESCVATVLCEGVRCMLTRSPGAPGPVVVVEGAT